MIQPPGGEVQLVDGGKNGTWVVQRPLFWLSLAFTAGIFTQRLPWPVYPDGEILSIAACILFAASLASLKFRGRTCGFCLSLLLFLVIGMWAGWRSQPELPRPARIEPFLDRPFLSYRAEVSAPPDYYLDKLKIPLRLISVLMDGEQIPLDIGVLVTMPGKPGHETGSFYLPGDRFLIRMTLRSFRNFKNPGGFDYVRYQAEKGFYASAYLKEEIMAAHLVRDDSSSAQALTMRAWGRIDLFRQKALAWLRASQDAESASFYAALVLGYQNLFDRTWQDHIQRTGLNHLLTVSGFHLGLVSLMVFWLVRLVVRAIHPSILNRVSDSRIAVWPAFACAVVYAFLAGFGVPPIWRSILMLAICFGAAFWYRSPDSLTVLALVAMIILAFDPNSLWQISCQLTFACVLAIIVIYPRLRRYGVSRFISNRTVRKIIYIFEEPLLGSIAVSALVLPLTVFYFNGLSLASFAANVVLVPYVGFLVLPWGLLSFLAFSLNETFAWPFIWAAQKLLAPCLYLIKWFSSFSWSYFWTGSISFFTLFLIYAAIGLAFGSLSNRRKLAGLAALAYAG